MMIFRSHYLVMLLTCFLLTSVHAEPKSSTGTIQGKVSDIINVTSYTYAEIDTSTGKIWVAGPTTALKKGDTVSFSSTMPMKDFYSESMERTFSLIYFIGKYNTKMETETKSKSEEAVTSSSTPPAHGKIKNMRNALAKIEPVDGGKTIAEVHIEKAQLKGQTIKVRGQVTRFSADIMGKNWLHIQDSSSFDDLTVTTPDTVAIGDVVIIEGLLELDKDYDYGYMFPVIVQDAKVTKE